MFTGLVQAVARVELVRTEPPGIKLVVAAPAIATTARIGDSISVNGCCLTVVDVQKGQLTFEAGPETLARTTLGRLTEGSRVNLEPALAVGERLGGHFVTGHVDTVGTLLERKEDRAWSTLWFGLDVEFTRGLASKGSIAVDGVSLTLVDVEKDRFSVALVPHTLAHTTLGELVPGNQVNLEIDLLAKYVQQLLMQMFAERAFGPTAGPGNL